jgi:hypothetical protein
MKILQIASSSDTENGTMLYALADDGKVYFWRDTCKPREQQYTDPNKPSEFRQGWTEGWYPLAGGISRPTFHPNDPTRHEHE